jgi:hypothetical protein
MYGSGARKPTGLWSNDLTCESLVAQCDHQLGHKPLFGRTVDGKSFRTTAFAKYPPPFSTAIATRIVAHMVRNVEDDVCHKDAARSHPFNLQPGGWKPPWASHYFVYELLEKYYSRELFYEVTLFKSELQTRGLSLGSLTEERLDWILADYPVEWHDTQDSSSGLSGAAALVASLTKLKPRHKYSISWKVLDVWRTRHPPKQAPSMPRDLAYAVVSWMTLGSNSQLLV